MICYRDMTFCVSPDCTNECGRKLTPEIQEAAKKWWGGDDAPIAMSCFCGGDLTEVINERKMTQLLLTQSVDPNAPSYSGDTVSTDKPTPVKPT